MLAYPGDTHINNTRTSIKQQRKREQRETHDEDRVVRRGGGRVQDLRAQAQDRPNRHGARERDAVERQELDVPAREHRRVREPELHTKTRMQVKLAGEIIIK
jgi:hypothetical protein